MSKKQDQSRQEWELDIWERHHNLLPAEITRTSQYHASGQPKDSPLASSVGGGIAAVIGIAGGTGGGCCLILTSVRWIGK